MPECSSPARHGDFSVSYAAINSGIGKWDGACVIITGMSHNGIPRLHVKDLFVTVRLGALLGVELDWAEVAARDDTELRNTNRLRRPDRGRGRGTGTGRGAGAGAGAGRGRGTQAEVERQTRVGREQSLRTGPLSSVRSCRYVMALKASGRS